MGLEPRGHASWSASGRGNLGYKVEFPRKNMTSPYPVRGWKRGCSRTGFFCQGYLFEKGHSPLSTSVDSAEEMFSFDGVNKTIFG